MVVFRGVGIRKTSLGNGEGNIVALDITDGSFEILKKIGSPQLFTRFLKLHTE